MGRFSEAERLARDLEADRDDALIRAVAAGQFPPWEDHKGELLLALCRRYVAQQDDGR